MVEIRQWVALDDGTDGLVTEIDRVGGYAYAPTVPRLHVEQRHFPWSDAVLRDAWVLPSNVVGDGVPLVNTVPESSGRQWIWRLIKAGRLGGHER